MHTNQYSKSEHIRRINIKHDMAQDEHTWGELRQGPRKTQETDRFSLRSEGSTLEAACCENRENKHGGERGGLPPQIDRENSKNSSKNVLSVNAFNVVFKCWCFNIDKLNELKLRLDTKPSIIALQEVKPKNFRFERILSEYNIEGYEIESLWKTVEEIR